MILPPDSAERIAAAVEAAEGHTSAEVVVSGVPFSGSYRDVEYLVGVVAAAGFLLWALFSVHHVPELAVLPSMLMIGAAGAALGRFSPLLRRLLTSEARRRRQVDDAARLIFLAHGVDQTRARTGVLIHVSFLERHVSLVVDRGIQAELSAEELEAERLLLDRALREADPVAGLCQAVTHLGQTLGERLPRDEDDIDELSNLPLLHGASS